MVEIYRERYVFPARLASYGEYLHDWTWQKVEDQDCWFDFDDLGALFKVGPRSVQLLFSRKVLEGYFGDMSNLPVLKEGIVVNGHGLILREIPE